MAEVVLRESCLASRKKPLVGLLREGLQGVKRARDRCKIAGQSECRYGDTL